MSARLDEGRGGDGAGRAGAGAFFRARCLLGFGGDSVGFVEVFEQADAVA